MLRVMLVVSAMALTASARQAKVARPSLVLLLCQNPSRLEVRVQIWSVVADLVRGVTGVRAHTSVSRA